MKEGAFMYETKKLYYKDKNKHKRKHKKGCVQ